MYAYIGYHATEAKNVISLQTTPLLYNTFFATYVQTRTYYWSPIMCHLFAPKKEWESSFVILGLKTYLTTKDKRYKFEESEQKGHLQDVEGFDERDDRHAIFHYNNETIMGFLLAHKIVYICEDVSEWEKAVPRFNPELYFDSPEFKKGAPFDIKI